MLGVGPLDFYMARRGGGGGQKSTALIQVFARTSTSTYKFEVLYYIQYDYFIRTTFPKAFDVDVEEY